MRYDNLFSQMKFFWEWGVVFSAGFWMGILWRRTNRRAVWYSILLTMVLFFLVPLVLPGVFTNLRSNQELLLTTKSRIVEREYAAQKVDVVERNAEITRWEQLSQDKREGIKRPAMIKEGERFVKRYKLPEKSIFWTQGIETQDGQSLTGKGMISLELVLLQKLGFKLQNNTYALNETIRIIIRALFPFLVIVTCSFLYKHTPEEKNILDRFYVKMRTKVHEDREKDMIELDMSYADPRRFAHKRMFPGTQWEILKLNKEDAVGLMVAVAMVFVILGLLFLVVNLGG
ncbi:MAG: hypothetical protein HC896_15615 [Bacteroidales bacterium]|nr:hypothetical protein [Bacteroidales bacterium]